MLDFSDTASQILLNSLVLKHQKLQNKWHNSKNEIEILDILLLQFLDNLK